MAKKETEPENKLGKAPAFQMYASDFLTDTTELTVCEVGCYIRLLLYQWINDDLPNDIRRLSFICGVSVDEMESCWKLITHKFILNDKFRLYNPRLHETKVKQNIYREARSKAGKAGNEMKNILRGAPILETVTKVDKKIAVKKIEIVEYPWLSEGFVIAWERWKTYKKEEKNQRYKTALSETQALRRLHGTTQGNEAYAIECIDLSISRQWQGVYADHELKEKYEQGNNKNAKPGHNPGTVNNLYDLSNNSNQE